MKKIVLVSFLLVSAAAPSHAVDWWLRPTICRPSTALCYSSCPSLPCPGYVDKWDAGAACNGMKVICANAVADGASADEEFSKAEISGAIDPCFDISEINGARGCFGVRKTKNNGTSAQVCPDNGKPYYVYDVKVYCPGALKTELKEELANGYIITDKDEQPGCDDLADTGYIGVLNGRCWGKGGYPKNDYFLACDGGDLPKQIVKRNDAGDKVQVLDSDDPKPNHPLTEDDAVARFNKMIKAAAKKQEETAKAAAAAEEDG